MSNVKFKFEDLKVYNKALGFVNLVYKSINDFPKTERYALSPQFTRASVSITLNITEGSGDSNAQFNRFLQIALNPIKECVVCSDIANRQHYTSNETNNEIRERFAELSKMITGLQEYLKSKI